MGSSINLAVRLSDGRVKTGNVSLGALTEAIQSHAFTQHEDDFLWSIIDNASLEEGPAPLAPEDAGLVVIDAVEGDLHVLMDGSIEANTVFVVRFALQAKMADWQERLSDFERLASEGRITAWIEEDPVKNWRKRPWISYDDLKDLAMSEIPVGGTVRVEFDLRPWRLIKYQMTPADSSSLQNRLGSVGLNGDEGAEEAWTEWFKKVRAQRC